MTPEELEVQLAKVYRMGQLRGLPGTSEQTQELDAKVDAIWQEIREAYRALWSMAHKPEGTRLAGVKILQQHGETARRDQLLKWLAERGFTFAYVLGEPRAGEIGRVLIQLPPDADVVCVRQILGEWRGVLI